MWNLSSPLADTLFAWSNVILIFGAALVLIGTIGSIKLAAVREHFADIRISDNESATKQAIAESDVAKADAARAAERTKEAELKLAQLRKLSGPRDINLEVFKRELEGKPKATVAIWYLPDSSDGYWFASRLQAALGVSGWTIEGHQPTPIPEPDPDGPNGMILRNMPRAAVAGGQPWGVTLVGDAPMGTSPDQNADTPFNALFNALAKSTIFGMYGSGGSQFTPVPTGTLRVVVAAKADPMFMDSPADDPKTANPK